MAHIVKRDIITIPEVEEAQLSNEVASLIDLYRPLFVILDDERFLKIAHKFSENYLRTRVKNPKDDKLLLETVLGVNGAKMISMSMAIKELRKIG